MIHLITGASGFIGRHLVLKLLNEGKTVWVLIRNITESEKIFSDYKKEYPNHFKIITGDVTKKNLEIDMKQFPKNDDIIVWHLAANLSFSKREMENVLYTNVEGTKQVVEFANRYATKLFFMSTAYVWGKRKNFCSEEKVTDTHHRNVYEKSKFLAENIVFSQCKIPYIIFRPSIVIGNAYEGKAVGCTFGYYRFTYLFYFLKSSIKTILLAKNSLIRKVLVIVGTEYDNKKDILSIPWLFMPYPMNSTVDLIPVDYIINSIYYLSQKSKNNIIYHLTNPSPPQYDFLLRALVEDLGIRKITYVPVPKSLFKLLFHVGYWLFKPLRKYIKSLMWYLPYITVKNNFLQNNNLQFNKTPVPLIDRECMRKINDYASKEIFRKISL